MSRDVSRDRALPDDPPASQTGEGDAGRTGTLDDSRHGSGTRVQDCDHAARAASASSTRPPVCVPGYEVEGELGRGAMGIVYKARQVKADRVVALKMILAGGHAGAGELARFRTEVEAAARLVHPNVVQVFEVGEHDGMPYFSMEYCPAGTLAKKLGGTPLPLREAAALVSILARAADAAHALGVLHRDLKPENILVGADGAVKISDFGIARRLDAGAQRTRTGVLLGTPSYMAPEQAAGDKGVGPAADVYALGAVLYECLTGRPPFKGATSWDTIDQVLRREPVAPHLLNPSLPTDLSTVCLKCLQKEPERRYATALDLAEDLDSYLAGRPVKARPVGRAARAWRWCRRNPFLAAVTLAATLATASAIGLLVGLVAYQARTGHDLQQKQQATETALVEKQGALAQAENSFRDARRQYALLALDRGVTLCESGDAAQGVQFLVAGLEYATQSGDPNLQRFVRTSLGAWRRQLVPLASMVRHQGGAETVALSPDGRHVATTGSAGEVVLREVASGYPVGASLRVEKGATRVVYSPDGRFLAVRDGTHAVRLWEVPAGKPVGGPLVHEFSVEALAFAPDSGALATGSNGFTRLWKIGAAAPVGQPVRVGQVVRSITFDSAGRMLAVSGGDKPSDPPGEAWLWASAGAEKPVRLDAEGNVYRAAFLPGRGAVLTVSKVDRSAGSRVRAWSSADGRQVAQPWDWRGAVELLVPRSDGQVVALARGPEATLLTVNLDKAEAPCLSPGGSDSDAPLPIGTAPPRLAHLGSVTAVAFNPDGTRVITAGVDGVAQFWDAEGRRLGESMDHQGQVTGAAFDPAGRIAMTVCTDGLVRFWDARVAPISQFRTAGADEDAADVIPFRQRQKPAEVALGPDGRVLIRVAATGGPLPQLEFWDTSRGQLIDPPVPHMGGLRETAEGRGPVLIQVKGGTSVRLWDTLTGKAIGEPFAAARWTRLAALAPDRRTAATAEDTSVFRWDLTTGRPIGAPLATDSAVTCLTHLPDGAIVSGHSDGTVRVWNGTAQPRTVLRGRLGEVRSLYLSPDGKRLLAVGAEAGAAVGAPVPRAAPSDRLRVVAQLWDIGTAQPVGEPLTQDGDIVVAGFSPDGALVATGAGNELRETGEARVWDATTARPLGAVLAHENRVTALAFGSAGLLATGSADQTARLWDVASGRALGPPVPLLKPSNLDEVGAVRFSADAARLVLAGSVGVQSWPTPRPVEAAPERLRLWVEVMSGKELDAAGGTQVLGPEVWWERRRRLDALGGSPAADPVMIAPLQERRKRFKELTGGAVPSLGLAGG